MSRVVQSFKTIGSWPRIVLFSLLSAALIGGGVTTVVFGKKQVQPTGRNTGPALIIMLGVILAIAGSIFLLAGAVPNIAERVKPGSIKMWR